MKLRDTTLQLYEKTLSHILFHVFCLYFFRIDFEYFFDRCFESVRIQFLSVESSFTFNLPAQSRLI